MERKQTVGEASTQLRSKTDAYVPTDIQQEVHKDFEKNLLLAIADGKQKYDGDFYIVVLTKKEKTMNNVVRNFFFARQTCPTPEWDQSVYAYHRKDEAIEYIWTVPARDICAFLAQNASSLNKEQYQLLRFVIAFTNGELLAESKKRNNECISSLLIER